jgi:hypothetical protein
MSSKVKVNGNYGFVGLDGMPVELLEHAEFDADHPMVKARPELFDEVPEPAPKRPVLGRPKSKGTDD